MKVSLHFASPMDVKYFTPSLVQSRNSFPNTAVVALLLISTAMLSTVALLSASEGVASVSLLNISFSRPFPWKVSTYIPPASRQTSTNTPTMIFSVRLLILISGIFMPDFFLPVFLFPILCLHYPSMFLFTRNIALS